MSTKKIIFWVVLAILTVAGIVYGIIWSPTQNLMVGYKVNIDNPLAGSEFLPGGNLLDTLNNGLTGTIDITITNPTPFGFSISSVYAEVVDPSGAVLANITEPYAGEIIPNGSTTVSVAFNADVVAGAASAISQLLGTKSAGITLTGKVYFLRGLVWYSFSQNESVKV